MRRHRAVDRAGYDQFDKLSQAPLSSRLTIRCDDRRALAKFSDGSALIFNTQISSQRSAGQVERNIRAINQPDVLIKPRLVTDTDTGLSTVPRWRSVARIISSGIAMRMQAL